MAAVKGLLWGLVFSVVLWIMILLAVVKVHGQEIHTVCVPAYAGANVLAEAEKFLHKNGLEAGCKNYDAYLILYQMSGSAPLESSSVAFSGSASRRGISGQLYASQESFRFSSWVVALWRRNGYQSLYRLQGRSLNSELGWIFKRVRKANERGR